MAAELPGDAAAEIRSGQRFAFGDNWSRFLRVLDEDRIREAEQSLRGMLGVSDFVGLRLLDIGCGSGLFSLAARRLGARVHSFDYDPRSVACATELRRRYFPDDHNWVIEQASVLDENYIGRLGSFDVVYSWGVLHHTGQMWTAVEQAIRPVRPDGGRMWIALYNTQRLFTPWWKLVKRGYLRTPEALRPLYTVPFFAYVVLAGLAADIVHGRNPRTRYRGRGRRGMSPWYDIVDWVGGWPFETATPEEVVAFAQALGLEPVTVKSVGRRHGCNEFVFRREATPA